MNTKHIVLFYFWGFTWNWFPGIKKIKNISDYYVGGKTLSFWIAAFSARATGESGWLLIGVTGMGAVMGVSAFWIVVGGFRSFYFLAIYGPKV